MKKYMLFCLLLASCTPEKTDDFNGYIEGEYVYLSPYTGGILEEISAVKGQNVQTGDRLFSVDSKIWAANVVQAENELEKALARFADLGKGKRKQELDIILRQKAQAVATLENARQEFYRAKELVKTGTLSQAEYDRRLSDYKNAEAKVSELTATLETAMLSAREDELKSAQNDIEIARQNLLKIQKQADHNTVVATLGGRVEDIYFRLGEFVPAGTPVLSVLPPENVKVRFYVPEKMFSKIRPNEGLKILCDGCVDPIKATVSFISSKSEFTPPVIYSVESREKLVFMVEAEFEDKTQNLHPGQPVTVRIDANE